MLRETALATNQHTLLRQWHMLRLVPRSPAKVSVLELQSRLLLADFKVTTRTIQRDLIELAGVFPLFADDRSKPFGWSWARDGASFDLPGLGISEALMLSMVDQYLQNHLPPATLDAMRPYFKTAAQALASVTKGAGARTWGNKVRTVSPVQPLLAPAVDETSQRVVYEALMQDQQLKLTYRKRGAAQPVVYQRVHPLAVVQRGQLIYLVCRFNDYPDQRILALHRILEAERLFVPARIDKGFSIDAYIRSGAFGFGRGGEITLEALFTPRCAEHLFETPLSADQILEPCADGRLRLKATAADSQELVWWLLGLGDGVEVVQPVGLRTQMRETSERMARMYRAQ